MRRTENMAAEMRKHSEALFSEEREMQKSTSESCL
jgi:hypothetical protein